MAVFLELTVDPFIERFRKVAGDKSRTHGAGLTRVRRPLRGLEVKEDTYAYLKLIRVDGVEIPLIDAGSETGESTSYSNFILQSVQEQRMERHQIVETFGETYVFLFGAAPHMLMCSAILINSHDFNWKDEFMENYQRYLRGTKALEYGARTYLFYDQNVVEGYILNAQVSIESSQPLIAQLQFQFFVTNAQTVALLGDPWFPVRDSVVMPEGVTLVETWNGEATQLVLDQTIEGSSYWLNQGYGVSSAPPYPGADPSAPPKANNMLEGVNNWVNGQAEDINEWLKAKQKEFNDWLGVTEQSATDTAATDPASAVIGMQPSLWARDRPIREKTYAMDNGTGLTISDEYTGPMQPTFNDLLLVNWDRQRLQEIEDLERSVNDLMRAFGAEGFEDPSFWESLGMQPPEIGGSVSWGSFPGSDKIGGWVGSNVDIPDALGDIGDTLKGLPGPFGKAGKAVVGAAEDVGGYVSDQANSVYDWTKDQAKSGYDWAAGKATSAYAYAKDWVDGAASDAAKAAARAGGYVGVNEYLSWLAKNVPVQTGTSMNSTGASNEVSGAPVPFAFVSLPGTLSNEDMPPEAVVGNNP